MPVGSVGTVGTGVGTRVGKGLVGSGVGMNFVGASDRRPDESEREVKTCEGCDRGMQGKDAYMAYAASVCACLSVLLWAHGLADGTGKASGPVW